MAFAVPPTVKLGDGLSEPEAAALALWNSAEFRAQLSELGVARADWVQARLLPNPSLSLLAPTGPKQLEATLSWAVDAVWQRPHRLALADQELEIATEVAVLNGLDRVLAVRRAYADAVRATAASSTTDELAQLAEHSASILASRGRAGQVVELEVSAARGDAVAARARAEDAVREAQASRRQLEAEIGADPALRGVPLAPLPDALAGELPEAKRLGELALAARPEARIARLRVDAAAARLGWERSRVLALALVVDANQEGSSGWEGGPGVVLELPIFSRNQAGVIRAESEAERAAWLELAAQRSVPAEVADSRAEYTHARAALERWRSQAIPAFQRQSGLARAAANAGAISFTRVIEAERRVLEGRLRELQLVASLRRARAQLERSIGGGLDAD